MEYLFYFVIIFAVYLIGFALGQRQAKNEIHKNTLGTIRVDHSDPDDGPYLFLELKTHPDALSQREYATFKVNVSNYISHK